LVDQRGGVADLPLGTVTFLFTDLESSTRRWQDHPEAMKAGLARHDAIVRDAVESHGGYVVKTTGDGFHAAFAAAHDATDAAIAAQLSLVQEPWGETGPLRVRMGIHSGPAELRDGDYYGTAVNRAARLMSVAHGNQIVLSLATSELVRDAPVEFVDLGEHRLQDLGSPERIFQVTHAGLPVEFAPLRSLDSYASNLPLQMTSFVGRGRELVEIAEVFDDARVVTLTGVGGVGKTRLAVQVGAELLPRFGDGVWLCELGPIADRSLVPEVVAAALNVQQRPGLSPAESILAACRSRELVLVLDNCEHLLDAAAALVEALVRACPGVRVLATSREGLGVSGERILVVRSLGLPDPHGLAGSPTDEADAVRLFCDRAASARDGFVLGPDNFDAVAQTCARLDGIPLAIELAAARVRMMTPGEIAGRLDERFRLLTGGARTAVERHQTLRQAVDWSYDLLAPREREVLNRLGVFAGGFTLDAAESVAAGGGIETFDVLEGLGQLVDKSLVVADVTPAGTRYRLLETIRQYALERLDDAGATDTARRRHATWCAGFVAQSSIGMQGTDEATWWDRLDREIENLRAALTWATGADDAGLSLSLIGDFGFWNLYYGRRLGYVLGPWSAAALATTGARDDPRFARVLAVRAIDHLNHQRSDEASRDARRAIDLMTGSGAPFSVRPWCVWCLGLVVSGRAGEVEGADPFLDAARATGDDYTVATALTVVASWWYTLANAERCLPFAEEAVLLAQRIGNPTLIEMSGSFLAGALETTDPPRARTVLEAVIGQGEGVDFGSHALIPLAWLARMGSDAASTKWARRFRSGLDLTYEAGDAEFVLSCLDLYAQALANTDRAESAALLSASVGRLAPHMSNPISVAHRRDTSERLLAQLGEDDFAELSAQGASLGYEEAVALARAELDRVIATDEA
jgi:predicted ATPase/class 3 adenylate cyclase